MQYLLWKEVRSQAESSLRIHRIHQSTRIASVCLNEAAVKQQMLNGWRCFSVFWQKRTAKVSMFNARTIMHPKHIPRAAEEFHQQWLKLNISYYLLTLQNLMFTCLISAGCCIRTLQLDCGNTSTPEGCISPRLKGCLSSAVCGFSWPLVVKSLIKQHGRSLPEDAINKRWQLRHSVDAVTLINVKEMNCWFLTLLFQ